MSQKNPINLKVSTLKVCKYKLSRPDYLVQMDFVTENMNLPKKVKIEFLLLISFVSICVASKVDVIDKFLSTSHSYKTLAICGNIIDQDYKSLLDISDQNMIHVKYWNCSQMVYEHNTLMIFVEPNVKDLETVLNQSGAQNCLHTNTWLIFHDDMVFDMNWAIGRSQLRIGLNAKIFLVDKSKSIKQVLGTGSIEVILEV